MTPTMKLRFVKRYTPMQTFPDGTTFGKTTYVLQQWWESRTVFDTYTDAPAGEWRDVPMEDE